MPAPGSEGKDKHSDKGLKLAVNEPAVVRRNQTALGQSSERTQDF
jgi:hypothetical protein